MTHSAEDRVLSPDGSVFSSPLDEFDCAAIVFLKDRREVTTDQCTVGVLHVNAAHHSLSFRWGISPEFSFSERAELCCQRSQAALPDKLGGGLVLGARFYALLGSFHDVVRGDPAQVRIPKKRGPIISVFQGHGAEIQDCRSEGPDHEPLEYPSHCFWDQYRRYVPTMNIPLW